MSKFHFEIDVSATYGTTAPTLEILLDGVVVSSTLVSTHTGSGVMALYYEYEYSGSAPSSLQFQFNDGSSEPGRSIEVSAARINGWVVDTTYISMMTFQNGQTSTVSITNVDHLFGRLEPVLADFSAPTITGTSGDDAIIGSTDPEIIDAGDGADRVRGLDSADVIFGGIGADTIFGGSSGDVINGDAGDDSIYGEAGDDLLHGGLGNDTINGGDGNDTINGGADVDTLLGGLGNDIIFGEAGNDTLSGGAGNDTLYSDAGDDVLTGGAGNDTLYGGLDNDRLYGDAGDDTLYGEAGNDALYGAAGADTLYGGLDNDTLYGGIGNDALYGDSGIDTIEAGAGNDTIDGGADSDTLSYSTAAGAVTVNLTTGTASNDGSGGTDTISNIESIIGGAFADTITGKAVTGTLSGGAGADTINSASTDTLTTQINAILAANAGVIYDSTTGSFYKYVNTNATATSAATGAAATTINGLAGHVAHVTSAYENNMLDTLVGTDEIWLGSNDVTTEGAWVFSGGVLNGIQFWSGGAAGSAVNGFYTNWSTAGGGQPNNSGGGGGSDYQFQLTGGKWDDLVATGKAKNSYVIEWEGSQLLTATHTVTLSGGDGLDNLYGAAGQDIFLFEAASAFNNIDKIYNYDATDLDKIDIGDVLSGYVAGASDDDLFAKFTVSGADLLLQVDANGATGGSSYTTIANLVGMGTSGMNIEEMVANNLLVMV